MKEYDYLLKPYEGKYGITRYKRIRMRGSGKIRLVIMITLAIGNIYAWHHGYNRGYNEACRDELASLFYGEDYSNGEFDLYKDKM